MTRRLHLLAGRLPGVLKRKKKAVSMDEFHRVPAARKKGREEKEPTNHPCPPALDNHLPYFQEWGAPAGGAQTGVLYWVNGTICS